jgi:AbiV family abortive infection protein
LTFAQIDQASEAAFANAVALLEEADMLRREGRCARAYFLTHICCEELGKLPILAALAVRLRMKFAVDWKKVDHALRSHEDKIKQVLFMDSLHGEASLRDGATAYDEDVKMMRMHTDLKNSALYSFQFEGQFLQPDREISCDFFDTFRKLAEGRLRAFEGMYLRLPREAGGIEGFLTGREAARVEEVMPRLFGDEGRAAFEEYQRSGDEAGVRAFFDRLIDESRNSGLDVTSERTQSERDTKHRE